MRSTLEAEGWRLVGSTFSAQSGSTQAYEKSGMSLQVRIWEGGPFSWYTYVEMAAIEVGTTRATSGHVPMPGQEGVPRIVPAPVPGAAPALDPTPRPSASADSMTPAVTITR
jgi:hypothetical protein